MIPKSLPGGKTWRRQVAEEFLHLGELYAATDNLYRQRKIASTLVAQMLVRFTELGVFEDDADALATMPIVNVLAMFRDLEIGRRHEWAEPASIGGSRIERTSAREVRLWALTATSLLIDVDLKPTNAFREVAAALAVAGYDYSPGALKSWWYRSRTLAESDRLSAAKAAFLETSSNPLTLARAREFLSGSLIGMLARSF